MEESINSINETGLCSSNHIVYNKMDSDSDSLPYAFDYWNSSPILLLQKRQRRRQGLEKSLLDLWSKLLIPHTRTRIGVLPCHTYHFY